MVPEIEPRAFQGKTSTLLLAGSWSGTHYVYQADLTFMTSLLLLQSPWKYSLLSPFSVAHMCVCSALAPWDGITYQLVPEQTGFFHSQYSLAGCSLCMSG